MNALRFVTTGTVLLVVAGCGNGREASDLTAPSLAIGTSSAAAAPSPARQVDVAGTFEANVDFSTLTLTPRGNNCRLEVDGELDFTGTIQGTAVAHTSALVSAPCAQVATTPPGTFSDVFRSEAVFTGTVNGRPAEAKLLYMGGVQPGGAIDGRLIFSNGVAGRLEAEARVAVGGTYRGQVVVR